MVSAYERASCCFRSIADVVVEWVRAKWTHHYTGRGLVESADGVRGVRRLCDAVRPPPTTT